MAYPNNIGTENNNQVNDFLEYFVGALHHPPSWNSTTDALIYSAEDNPIRGFPPSGIIYRFLIYMGNTGYSTNPLPITRGYLYEIFDSWIHDLDLENNPDLIVENYFSTTEYGLSLYNFESPEPNWSKKMVIDWGKMKVIEYALFGNCGSDPDKRIVDDSMGVTVYAGGLSDTTLPEFNGQTILASALNWKKTKLSYLRCGLAQFDNYGIYSNNSFPEVLPITSIIVNQSTRQITWTVPYGSANHPSLFEITYDGGATWQNVATLTVTAPQTGFGSNQLGIRYKARNYFNPSPAVYSPDSLPDISPLSISAEVYRQGPEYYCKLKTSHRMAVHYYVTARFQVNSYGTMIQLDVPLSLPSNSWESNTYVGDEYANKPFSGMLLNNTSNPSVGTMVSVTGGGSKELALRSFILFELM